MTGQPVTRSLFTAPGSPLERFAQNMRPRESSGKEDLGPTRRRLEESGGVQRLPATRIGTVLLSNEPSPSCPSWLRPQQ